MYKSLRKLLFLFPAESVHYFAMNLFRIAGSAKTPRKIIQKSFEPQGPGLEREVFGLKFKNPVGLAAGFDKNARYLRELEALGFGSVEIGTVTPVAQKGNPKPRLFRLSSDKALINRMGFNNDGVAAVSARLQRWKIDNPKSTLIIGGNIGKNKDTPNDEAWRDYEKTFSALADFVDYFVVNVSSPNTPGLRELQEKESLRKILEHLQTLNAQRITPRPVLLKIAPDLTPGQTDDVIDLALEIKLDGLVIANTTLDRNSLSDKGQKAAADIGPGGLSGAPLRKKSTEILRYIHSKIGQAVPLIASGGIFTGDDAKEKLQSGATLVQVWTGFIYEGPAIVRKICKDLQMERYKGSN